MILPSFFGYDRLLVRVNEVMRFGNAEAVDQKLSLRVDSKQNIKSPEGLVNCENKKGSVEITLPWR